MKRIIAFLLSVTIFTCFCSCKKEEPQNNQVSSEPEQEKVNIDYDRENTIKSVTLSFYESSDSGISYGVTWQSDFEPYEPVIQIVESDAAEPDFSKAKEIKTEPAVKYIRFKTNSDEDYYAFTSGREDTLTYCDVYTVKAVILGLKEGKTYKYRVGDKALEHYSAVGTINTPTQSQKNFSFLFMTDSQYMNTTGNIWGVALGKALSSFSPDFMLHGGDLVQWGPIERNWTDVLDANKKHLMSLPLMITAGNHEYNIIGKSSPYNVYSHFNIKTPNVTDYASFASEFTYDTQHLDSGIYYSFDYKNTHFIVLNSNEAYGRTQGLSTTQLEWLKRDLAGTKKSNIIVSMHFGLYAISESANPSKSQYKNTMALRSALGGLFAQYGVDLVLNGHDHVYSVTNPLDANGNVSSKGVVYLTAPVASNQGAGAYTGADSDYTVNKSRYKIVKERVNNAWCEVSVSGSQIKVEVYNTDARGKTEKKLIDSFIINAQ